MDVCKCRQMKAICYLPYPLCHLIRPKVACWKLGRKRRRTQSPTWNSLLVLLWSAYIFILSWVLRIWSLSTRRTASRSYSNSSTACTLAVLGICCNRVGGGLPLHYFIWSEAGCGAPCSAMPKLSFFWFVAAKTPQVGLQTLIYSLRLTIKLYVICWIKTESHALKTKQFLPKISCKQHIPVTHNWVG